MKEGSRSVVAQIDVLQDLLGRLLYKQADIQSNATN